VLRLLTYAPPTPPAATAAAAATNRAGMPDSRNPAFAAVTGVGHPVPPPARLSRSAPIHATPSSAAARGAAARGRKFRRLRSAWRDRRAQTGAALCSSRRAPVIAATHNSRREPRARSASLRLIAIDSSGEPETAWSPSAARDCSRDPQLWSGRGEWGVRPVRGSAVEQGSGEQGSGGRELRAGERGSGEPSSSHEDSVQGVAGAGGSVALR
jgi:hypothetical protein